MVSKKRVDVSETMRFGGWRVRGQNRSHLQGGIEQIFKGDGVKRKIVIRMVRTKKKKKKNGKNHIIFLGYRN